MTKLVWDKVGERYYETGVDRGVLYIPNGAGIYNNGYAWNGLTAVTQSPEGAEATPLYADNMQYLNLVSAEKFGCTIEAYTYPDEFEQCDGTAEPAPGVFVSQQTRKRFALCWRTLLGNDTLGNDLGYKLNIAYNCLAAPSEKAHASVNDSPEAVTFSWEVSTTPVDITGLKPSAKLTLDSTKTDPTALAALEQLLYGTVGTDPSLPMPNEIVAMLAGTITEVFPTAPTYVSGTHTLTIPSVTGVTYFINDEPQASGAQVITADTVVVARPNVGYKFPAVSDDDWYFDFV